jgi:hypothetical protein
LIISLLGDVFGLPATTVCGELADSLPFDKAAFKVKISRFISTPIGESP